MRKRIQFYILITVSMLALLAVIVFSTPAFALVKQGSQGEEVKQVQTRLAELGLYEGKVDGIAGTKTVKAIKAFQKKEGLKQDGIAGPATLAALGISGGATENSDLYLLARAIYSEARGEPYEGQVAVGAVIMNRVKHPSFPNTISGVIYQPLAFTAVADGQINLTPDEKALKAAQEAMNGADPTNGCLYYYNPKTSTSKWILTKEVVTVIGQHKFAI